MLDSLRLLWQDDSAQDIAEYALLLAVILVIVITVVTAIGTNANSIFSKAAKKLTDANAASN
jgi:Flp pilus assembly pilin Flp